MKIMIFLITITLLLISIVTATESSDDSLQIVKEKALADTLKNHMTCKNMKAYKDSDLYCKIAFRGLDIDIAGVNKKGGGTIYINALGKNQSVAVNGGHSITVIFSDEDLQGIMEAHIIIRDNGMITHNYKNKNILNNCYK